jgi:hypothetical protein
MAYYLARVELHAAPSDGEDYQTLHEQMEAQGLYRLIRSGDAWYFLPPAEYFADSDDDRATMFAKVKAAAEATGYTLWQPNSAALQTYSAIITQGAMTFGGLEKQQ